MNSPQSNFFRYRGLHRLPGQRDPAVDPADESSDTFDLLQNVLTLGGQNSGVESTFPLRLSDRVGPQALSLDMPANRDGFGLQCVLTVPKPIVDVILVHGLGGSRVRTWCYDGNPQYFWPSWLPMEGGVLAKLRVFSYGYNSSVKGAETSANILDFAKDLLHGMSTWYSSDEEGIGTVRAL
jgi:hypothetical protein